jgi:hypothetical protein
MSCCSHTCVCVYQMCYISLTPQTLFLFMLDMITHICYTRDMFYKSGHSIMLRTWIVFFVSGICRDVNCKIKSCLRTLTYKDQDSSGTHS